MENHNVEKNEKTYIKKWIFIFISSLLILLWILGSTCWGIYTIMLLNDVIQWNGTGWIVIALPTLSLWIFLIWFWKFIKKKNT